MSTAFVSDMPSRGVQRNVWGALAAGETGAGASMGKCREAMCVQVSGTFNTETVTLEGSLDGSAWAALTEDGTNAISFTDNGVANIFEPVGWVRPVCTSGAGVTIKVVV